MDVSCFSSDIQSVLIMESYGERKRERDQAKENLLLLQIMDC